MPASNAKYSIEIRDQYGRLQFTLVRPQSKQYDILRNKPGSLKFALDLYDPQANPQVLQMNIYDTVLKRLGVPIFAGQLSYIEPKIDDNDHHIVDIVATGYMNLLSYRVITTDFPNYDAIHDNVPYSPTDVGQIAWSLIQYTQFPVINDDVAVANGVQTLEQSFVAQGSAAVKQMQLLLFSQNVSVGANLVVSLINDLDGEPIGSVVPNSTMTIPASTITTTLGWTLIDYSAVNCQLTEGQTYWVKITVDTVQSGTNGIYWAFLDGNYYPAGSAFSLEQPNLFTPDQDLQFFVLLKDGSYQQTKNTYLGIQQGTIQPSFTLSPVFTIHKKIDQAITDMTNTLNGVDISFSISIDPVTNYMQKFFNVFYPGQGINNTGLPFNYPGNIKKIDKQKDGTTQGNEIIVRGQGSGIAQLVDTVRDIGSIQIYSTRQIVQDESDVSDDGTLVSLGNETLRTQKIVLDLPQIVLDGSKSPAPGSYGVGDTIALSISGPPLIEELNNTQYRIEEISTTINDDDQEEVTITISLA